MKKYIKDIFVFTLVPLLCNLILGGLFVYAAFIRYRDYEDIVWESLFGDIMPLFLGVVFASTLGNIVYCSCARRRGRYSFSRNIVLTVAGFCFALLIFVFWINA